MDETLDTPAAPAGDANGSAGEWTCEYADEYELNDIGLAWRLHAL
jgi:hypothetical protein